MAIVRITKIFRFEAAHFLLNYQGLCRNIHGHSYELHVTIAGVPKDSPGAPDDGLVIDFKELKFIVVSQLVEKFDHALIINELAGLDEIMAGLKLNMKIVKLPFQPTCENIVCYFADKINKNLPEEIRLETLRLYETNTSYAEWSRADNK